MILENKIDFKYTDVEGRSLHTQLADIIHFERSALYCGLFQVNKNPLPYESFFLLRFAFYNEAL